MTKKVSATKKAPATKKASATKKKIAKKAAIRKSAPRTLLSAGEPPPFRVHNPNGAGPGVIVSDHASARVPRGLKDMGLKKSVLRRHIGWDIGAEDVTLYLSRALDMPAVIAQYSRLVVDLNRAPQHPECMPEVSDHVAVPPNATLSKKERDLRLKEIFWPYQNSIGKTVDRIVKKGRVPVIISIHSFTPAMDGVRRPWHISLLWNKEKELARRIVQNIRRRHPDVLVGENQPYTLMGERFAGSTVHRHAEERGLPYIFVEFRQDLIATPQKATYWANLFLEAIRPVLEDASTYAGRKIRPLKK